MDTVHSTTFFCLLRWVSYADAVSNWMWRHSLWTCTRRIKCAKKLSIFVVSLKLPVVSSYLDVRKQGLYARKRVTFSLGEILAKTTTVSVSYGGHRQTRGVYLFSLDILSSDSSGRRTANSYSISNDLGKNFQYLLHKPNEQAPLLTLQVQSSPPRVRFTSYRAHLTGLCALLFLGLFYNDLLRQWESF